MLVSLSLDTHQLMDWSWPQIEPYYLELLAQPLDKDNVRAFLANWSRLTQHVEELQERLHVAVTQNTADREAEQRYHRYLDEIFPPIQAAEQQLKEKLLASGLEPAGFELPLRKMRTEVAIFQPANLPLLSQERKLANQYAKIIGAQTVEYEGQELTLAQLNPLYQNPDRLKREQVWRLASQRQLADQAKINNLWQQLLSTRLQIANNAGYPHYRDFRWQQLLRFDYTPANCHHFHQAIEAVVVPAATRIYEKRRRQLGLAQLRPWDLDVDPLGRPSLRPFQTITQLQNTAATIFQRVDPQLGLFFKTMIQENLLDLDNRKHKAPGGYCTQFAVVKRPFIFMNAVGLQDDVQTLLHEGGHAFHVFESSDLPYQQQLQMGMEFAEVASMGMELLASPYLAATAGGYYSQEHAARARLEHLSGCILFWPYMAVVDAFQHWVYDNPTAATQPDNCDAQWAALWQRFMSGVDWSNLEAEMMTGWQRKLHIHMDPFYYVEYGLAQLGAVQVWRNALADQVGAVAAYRQALALGGTVSLPELFATAGAKFAFDSATLQAAVKLIEETIDTLEQDLAL
jgi:oligoendopeptidase F